MSKKKKTQDDELEFELDIQFDEEITMIYLEFYDHAYSGGWTVPELYPTLLESMCVACGVLVAENDDYYLIATSVGKNANRSDVLNPFLVLKSTVKEAVTFTKEAFSNEKK